LPPAPRLPPFPPPPTTQKQTNMVLEKITAWQEFRSDLMLVRFLFILQ